MKTLHILVVEDSPADVRLIREAIKQTTVPVEITVATDGVEALNYLRQAEESQSQRPDLVLLDLNLPRKNGREVLAEVKANPNLKQIPILVMTSSQAEEDIAAAYALNANCYITKPAEFSEYMEVMRAVEEFWFRTATLADASKYPPRTLFLTASS